MVFNTHDRTPRPKMNKSLKILFFINFAILYSFFIFAAIATSISAGNIKPALLIVTVISAVTLLSVACFLDIKRPYVKIDEDNITVVDFLFFIKKEKKFTIGEIKQAEVVNAHSFKVRGQRLRIMGAYYIIFKGENNKYLFKIIYYPETKDFWEKYVKFDNTIEF